MIDLMGNLVPSKSGIGKATASHFLKVLARISVDAFSNSEMCHKDPICRQETVAKSNQEVIGTGSRRVDIILSIFPGKKVTHSMSRTVLQIFNRMP